MNKRPFLLLLCAALGWLIFWSSQEWRDWAASPNWQATTTNTFTIQPKSSRVRYLYQVAGDPYEGTRTHFFVMAPFQDQRVLAWINANRQATRLTVYYDPAAPGRSVLVREVDRVWAWQWPLICGVASVLILLPLLFFGWLWQQV